MKLTEMQIGDINEKFNIHYYDENTEMWCPYIRNGYSYFDEEYMQFIISEAKQLHKQIRVYRNTTVRVI